MLRISSKSVADYDFTFSSLIGEILSYMVQHHLCVKMCEKNHQHTDFIKTMTLSIDHYCCHIVLSFLNLSIFLTCTSFKILLS